MRPVPGVGTVLAVCHKGWYKGSVRFKFKLTLVYCGGCPYLVFIRTTHLLRLGPLTPCVSSFRSFLQVIDFALTKIYVIL